MRASVCLSAMVLMASVCSSALAGGATYSFAEPSIDRWMNPFNPTRGYRATASTFGSIGVNIPGFNFDDRYSQLLVGFDLLTQAPAGLGVCRYKVTAARVTLTVSEDLAFKYDPTFDILSTYTTADDGDGRPMEMFGVGYRNGWTSCRIDPSNAALSAFPCFYEGNAANPGPAFSATGQPNEDLRNVFASDNAGGVLRDVSNFVRDGLRVTPFAIGRIQGLASGALVPVDTDVNFDLDVENPDVQLYLKRAADTGLLRLMVASMHPASSQGGSGSGAFATFYCKEIGIPGLAARLTITIDILPVGDANGDGSVTFGDITTVLANFGTSGEGIPGDADCNGTVAFADVTAVLANFGN